MQKKELWRRWKEGESLSEIGRALGKHAGSIHGVVKAHGGIVPAARRRSARTLSFAEREEISRGLAHEEPVRRIAARLGRAPSTARGCVPPPWELLKRLRKVASSVQGCVKKPSILSPGTTVSISVGFPVRVVFGVMESLASTDDFEDALKGTPAVG